MTTSRRKRRAARRLGLTLDEYDAMTAAFDPLDETYAVCLAILAADLGDEADARAAARFITLMDDPMWRDAMGTLREAHERGRVLTHEDAAALALTAEAVALTVRAASPR